MFIHVHVDVPVHCVHSIIMQAIWHRQSNRGCRAAGEGEDQVDMPCPRSTERNGSKLARAKIRQYLILHMYGEPLPNRQIKIL